MTEAEARAALSAFDGVGGLERWTAAQPWEAAQDGWTVPGELHGWRFRPVPTDRGALITRMSFARNGAKI